MPRRFRLAACSFLVALLVPAAALAQGETAVPMRSGTFRFTLGGDWLQWDERFGRPNPSNPTPADGALEPLGVYFGSDSLSATQLGILAPLRDEIRALTGLGTYDINIGRARLRLDAQIRSHPFRLAFAPSDRLAFQVSVPVVRSRMTAFLAVPDSVATTQGNVGSFTAGSFDAFRLEAEAALAALATQAATGPVSLRPQAQAQLNQLLPLLCGLSNLGTTSASDQTSPCFGGISPSPVLPVAGTAAGDSITQRLTRAQQSYASLQTQYAAQGVTLPPLSTAFALPTTSLDSAGVRGLFNGAGSVLGADSLGNVVRTGIGDIELGGWFQLANAPGWRSQLSVMVRLPTGKMDHPDNLIDIGTGDHQMDVEVGIRNDIVVNRHVWLHAGGRYGVQLADELERRVTPWYLPLVPASNRALVRRDLGDYFAIDVVPNWQIDDAFGFGLGWHYFHQGATEYRYVDPTDEVRIGLPASVLGEATSISQMRVGAGVTFSTLERYRNNRARLPYRVSWSYNATLMGRGGQVPHAGVMMLNIQVFFGSVR